ncbi:MAG TPA: four helix bundle protein [bacterium]
MLSNRQWSKTNGQSFMSGFEKLEVWRIAKDLAVKIYRLSQSVPLNKDFCLRDQIRRCAVSIPSNIAEGNERDSNPDSIRHFRIAKGSLGEIRTQLIIAHEIGYLSDQDFEFFDKEYKKLGSKLGRLIEVRKASR